MKISLHENADSIESISDQKAAKCNEQLVTNTPGGGDNLGIYARFASTSPDILRFALQNQAARLLPGERVADCKRSHIPGLKSVTVLHSPHVKSAHYKNLMVCGSVWLCPVCASKITERRREELTAALAATDYFLVLVTFTLKHQIDDQLADLLKALMAAFRDFKSGNSWQLAAERYGWVGSIRALETTHGANGWHPHLHDLVLLESPLTAEEIDQMTTWFRERWLMVLQRHGRDASWYPSVDIRPGRADVGEYIAKFGRLPTVKGWTIEHEVTKAPVKRGRPDRRTPLQLLADSMAGDKRASALYVEYAKNFKGKKQLVWSKGLRALLGLIDQELTDEQLAQEEREPASVLLFLTIEQWKVIVGNDIRAELLEEAARGDREHVVMWLAEIGIYVYDDTHFGELIPLPGGVGLGFPADEF